MAEFTNQAILRYNNTVTNSNIVVGNIVQSLEISKTAVRTEYSADGDTTFVISLTNSGTTAYTGLTVTDNLGAYVWNETVLVPLAYIDGSLKYYINGVLQPDIEPTVGNSLVITGVNVPANGNTTLIYEVSPNSYAPLDANGAITNTATADGAGLAEAVAADEVITPVSGVQLSISKAISPATVTANGQVTYTFVIQNTGNAPADAALGAIVEDVFDPVLRNLTASYNGQTLTPGTDYTYDQTTGKFATTPGTITVAAAQYTRDEATGAIITTPSVGTLTVTGNI